MGYVRRGQDPSISTTISVTGGQETPDPDAVRRVTVLFHDKNAADRFTSEVRAGASVLTNDFDGQGAYGYGRVEVVE